jgi:hypothetical protein
MRFRLWHLMLIVLLSALAVMGYRLWPKPKILISGHVGVNVQATSPAPGLIRLSGSMNFMRSNRSGTFWYRVRACKDSKVVWEHAYNNAPQKFLAGKPATINVVPVEINVAPGRYMVEIDLIDGQTQEMHGGSGMGVTVD